MDFHDCGIKDNSLMSQCFVSYLRTTASYLLVIDWTAALNVLKYTSSFYLCWVLSKVVYMQRLGDFWQSQTCKKFVNLLVHYFLINFALMKLPVHDCGPRTLLKRLISHSSIIGLSKSSTTHMQAYMYTIDTIQHRIRPKRGQLFWKISSGLWEKLCISLIGFGYKLLERMDCTVPNKLHLKFMV